MYVAESGEHDDVRVHSCKPQPARQVGNALWLGFDPRGVLTS